MTKIKSKVGEKETNNLLNAIHSGEVAAKWMLENGSDDQKVLARLYLQSLENIRLTYMPPLQTKF